MKVVGVGVGGSVVVIDFEGCNDQEWFQIAAGLIPIVLQTVSAFTAPASLSPAALASLTQYATLAKTILDDAAADVKLAQNTPGVIPKLQAELTQLQQQSQALIPQFTGNKAVLTWANAILADVIDLIGLIPVVQGGGVTAKAAAVKKAPSVAALKDYQAVFQARLGQVQAL